MDSILESVKKNLGIVDEYTHFDPDIIMHINTVLMVLYQIGVGKKIVVEDKTTTWNDFLSNAKDLEMVKSYVYLRVKMLFDPPSSSVAIDAIKQQLQEFEWRLSVAVETPF